MKSGHISKSPTSPKQQLDIKFLLKNVKLGKAKQKADAASIPITEEVTKVFSPILGGDFNLVEVASTNDIEVITSLLR